MAHPTQGLTYATQTVPSVTLPGISANTAFTGNYATPLQPTGGTAASADTGSSFDLAAIAVTTRIAEFWIHMPRLWFAQFESVMAAQKQSDETKYNVVISKLNLEALQQVSDLLMNPPTQGKYQALKDRLLQVYEESADKQFKKLVSELELGTQKPSQLLRKMRELGRNSQASDQTLRNLWLSRLPAAIRAGLAVSQEQNMEKMAIVADKIMENLNAGDNISAVSTTSSPSLGNQTFPMGEMLTQLNKLSLEVASLRSEVRGGHRRSNYRGRGRGRGYHSGYHRGSGRYSRSRSRSQGAPVDNTHADDPNWLCRYHFKFRHQAQRCEKPCAWIEKKEN